MVKRKVDPRLLVRRRRVLEAMVKSRAEGLLLVHPPDLSYLSGFTGHDSVGVLTARSLTIVSDSRYDEQIDREAPDARKVLRRGAMAEAVAKVLAKAGCARIAFEPTATPYALVDGVGRALRALKATGRKLVPIEGILVQARAVKDDGEIATIRSAVRIAQEAFGVVRSLIRPGMTENALAARLVFEMRSRGASDSSFETIVGAGANSALPHYRPAEIAVAADQPLLFDWGARLHGYCSDLTRTLLIGRVDRRIETIYKTVLEAQLAGIAAVRPGASTRQVDLAARKVIRKAGFDKQFGHGLGHGIGLDIHEAPRLHPRTKDEILQPGMIVTVEPGIYLPGLGGVRIEDDVLVTTGGHEVLSSLDKSQDGARL